MITIRVRRGSYTFRHHYQVVFADTTHVGTEKGLHETTMLCETRYPYSHCRCGEYQLQWWL